MWTLLSGTAGIFGWSVLTYGFLMFISLKILSARDFSFTDEPRESVSSLIFEGLLWSVFMLHLVGFIVALGVASLVSKFENGESIWGIIMLVGTILWSLVFSAFVILQNEFPIRPSIIGVAGYLILSAATARFIF